MEDIKEEIKEEIKENIPVKRKKESKFMVINRNNAPYELYIGSIMYRLEPRGKEGDSVIITKKQSEHDDIKSALKKIVIQEVSE